MKNELGKAVDSGVTICRGKAVDQGLMAVANLIGSCPYQPAEAGFVAVGP